MRQSGEKIHQEFFPGRSRGLGPEGLKGWQVGKGGRRVQRRGLGRGGYGQDVGRRG